MLRLYLIRHGKSEYNQAKSALHEEEMGPGGNTSLCTLCDRDTTLVDAPLCSIGQQQAKKLKAPGVDVVFVSPLTRALQTAEILFPSMVSQFVVVPEAREYLSAICDIGQVAEVLRCRFPQVVGLASLPDGVQWWADGDSPSHQSPEAFAMNPQMERMVTFQRRLRIVLENYVLKAARTNAVTSIALVAHHDTIAYFVALNFGGSVEEYKLDNCEVLELLMDGEKCALLEAPKRS